MFLRKFAIWLVKNLIVLLLVTFIFSTVALDLPNIVKGVFRDIFQYSSPEAQKDVIAKLTSTCSDLDKNNPDDSQQGKSSNILFDFKKIGSVCKDYNGGKINDKEFFFNVIGTAIPDKLELPKNDAFDKYNKIIDVLTKNKIAYFLVLAVLLILLYLLVMNFKSFILILAGISFSIGILTLLPYAAIIAYDKLVGINTTPILSSILQGGFSFNPKAIISIILLMILRTYTSLIVVLGAVFLGIGIAGKIYGWKLLKNRGKKTETIQSKEAKKEIKKSEKDEDDAAEAYKHRDRTTKEILDDLEEIHKKKMKEKEKEN